MAVSSKRPVADRVLQTGMVLNTLGRHLRRGNRPTQRLLRAIAVTHKQQKRLTPLSRVYPLRKIAPPSRFVAPPKGIPETKIEFNGRHRLRELASTRAALKNSAIAVSRAPVGPTEGRSRSRLSRVILAEP